MPGIFFFFFFWFTPFFLACCKSELTKKGTPRAQESKYISMNIFPGLKIHHILQIVDTGISMHSRHMIWGTICYSMAMAVVFKKKIRLTGEYQNTQNSDAAFLSS